MIGNAISDCQLTSGVDCSICCTGRSRLGGNKIAYPPYSNHNMREIMVHRLATAADPRARNLFHSSALDLTTIKVPPLLPRRSLPSPPPSSPPPHQNAACE